VYIPPHLETPLRRGATILTHHRRGHTATNFRDGTIANELATAMSGFKKNQ